MVGSLGCGLLLAQPRHVLWTELAPLRMELTLDYRELTHGGYETYRKVPVHITLPDGSTDQGSIPLKVRGHFRQEYCQVPPLKLDFDQAGFSHPSLQSLARLKLVTHCRDSKSFYQYLMLEYHIYQAYQLFTPMSLGVRWVEITYRDEAGRKDPFTRWAFLIEDIDELAARNGCFEFEPPAMRAEYLDADQLDLMAMFELMVGNLDWYLGNLHNLKLIRSQDPAQATIYPVPYDFDYAGLVNARYALPPDRLNLGSVKDRYYLGPCPSEDRITEMSNVFLAQQEAVLAIFRGSPSLDAYHREEALAYLQDFFAMLARPQALQQLIAATCRRAE
jgi:hypothetical protein